MTSLRTLHGRRRLGAVAGLLLLPLAASAATPSAAKPRCFGRVATIVGAGEIVGTEGPDVIVGSAGDDVVFGLGGDDRICALGGGRPPARRPGVTTRSTAATASIASPETSSRPQCEIAIAVP